MKQTNNLRRNFPSLMNFPLMQPGDLHLGRFFVNGWLFALQAGKTKPEKHATWDPQEIAGLIKGLTIGFP